LALEAKGSRMEAIYTLLSKLVFPTYNFYTRFDSDFQAFSLQREKKGKQNHQREKSES